MTDTKSAAPSCGSMKPLSREAEHVLRNHGTERPGSSALNREKRAGAYFCAGCGTEVFSSATKYDSASGWPGPKRTVWPISAPGAVTGRRNFGASDIR